MNDCKEVLSFMIYMWNRWCENEAAIVFNGVPRYDDLNWEYSICEMKSYTNF